MSRLTHLRRRLIALRWTAFDAALALTLTIASVSRFQTGLPDEFSAFAVLMIAGIMIRRHWPVTAVVLAGLGVLGYHFGPEVAWSAIDLALPLTLYTLAGGNRPRRVVLFTFGSALASILLLSLLHVLMFGTVVTTETAQVSMPPEKARQVLLDKLATEADAAAKGKLSDAAMPEQKDQPRATFSDMLGATLGNAFGAMLVVGLAFAVGDNVRSRRAHLRTIEQRALDLEREQNQRVALAMAAERARITRELHDVVAHGLSVMVVQAQGAAAALRRHPDRTEAALTNVITTGRSSLAEMRRLLDLVRQDPAELTPQPGVGSLPELIDRVRAAGTPVTFTIDGEPVPLPISVDLTAYRIAQEALTNTIKHAGRDARAAVRLGFTSDELQVEVSDNGAGSQEEFLWGNGLRGIAERIGILGGDLTAGPLEAGGFLVLARLSLRVDTDEESSA